MRVFKGFPWVALVLAAPSLASAQVTVSDETTDARASARPRGTIVLDGRPSAGESESLVPEFHTVARGDTLWQISGTYFTNPWEWPRVWALNPQITNPHWIFPADQVRLLRTAPTVESGARVALPSGPRPSRDRLRMPAPRYPRGTIFLREEAWATPDSIESSGTIVGAPEDMMLLTEGDQMYIEFRRRAPNVGETYTIYNEGQQTQSIDRNAGRVVRVLGTAVVDSWDNQRRIATARITESNDTIERGERVAVVQRQFLPVPPVPNDRDVVGHIIGMPTPRTIVGGQYVVIVDRGERDGVRLGNRFFLTNRGDPWLNSTAGQSRASRRQELDRDGDGHPDVPPDTPNGPRANLPVEVTGEMTVISVHPTSCVCLVTLTQRELEIGAPAVMRRGY